MNYIDEILQHSDAMNANDIIQEVGVNIYKESINRDEILQYPQFIQDIIFLVDMDTDLNMEGEVVGYNQKYIPNMVEALNNIHAYNEAVLLQNIYDTYNSVRDEKDEDKLDEAYEVIDGLYNKMYLRTDFDIWSLLEIYVEYEKDRK